MLTYKIVPRAKPKRVRVNYRLRPEAKESIEQRDNVNIYTLFFSVFALFFTRPEKIAKNA